MITQRKHDHYCLQFSSDGEYLIRPV